MLEAEERNKFSRFWCNQLLCICNRMHLNMMIGTSARIVDVILGAIQFSSSNTAVTLTQQCS